MSTRPDAPSVLALVASAAGLDGPAERETSAEGATTTVADFNSKLAHACPLELALLTSSRDQWYLAVSTVPVPDDDSVVAL